MDKMNYMRGESQALNSQTLTGATTFYVLSATDSSDADSDADSRSDGKRFRDDSESSEGEGLAREVDTLEGAAGASRTQAGREMSEDYSWLNSWHTKGRQAVLEAAADQAARVSTEEARQLFAPLGHAYPNADERQVHVKVLAVIEREGNMYMAAPRNPEKGEAPRVLPRPLEGCPPLEKEAKIARDNYYREDKMLGGESRGFKHFASHAGAALAQYLMGEGEISRGLLRE